MNSTTIEQNDYEEIIELSADNENKQIDSSNSNVAKSSIKMAIATIASRFTGLLRVWAMAFALGSTATASAFNIAYNMPSLICDLVVGGIVGAAFLPVYLLAKEEGKRAASNNYGSSIINWFILILGFISILCSVFAPEVIYTQTFTISSDTSVSEQAIIFFRIFAFQILFFGVGGVLSGILNAEKIFGLPSLAPAINNVIVSSAFFIYVPLSSWNAYFALVMLAFATTCGVFAQMFIQIPLLKKSGFHWQATLHIPFSYLKETFKITLPTLIYIVGMLIAFTFRNAYSLNATEDGPAILSYAWTWFQLPYGIISVSLTTALFTEMGEAEAKQEHEVLRSTIYQGIIWTIFLIAPCAILLASLSTSIMGIFQAGAFTEESVDAVSLILCCWACGLPLYAIQMFLYRVFSAIRKAFSFALISTVLAVVQCSMYFVFTQWIGLIGIPIADIIYYALMVICLWFWLTQQVGDFVYDYNGFIKECLKIGIATVVCGGVALLVYFLLTLIPYLSNGGILPSFIILATAGIIGLLVFYVFANILKVKEVGKVNGFLSHIIARFRR